MTSSLALVGAGVRGTAALGRVAARLQRANPPRLDIHVIDPFTPGAGTTWRTDQPRALVMNTVAAQSTVFDDASLGFSDAFPGPTFAQWCEGIASGDFSDELPWVRDLARTIVPWSSPSRALYGRYLQWAFRRFAAALPATVELHVHPDRATSLRQEPGGYAIDLTSGDRVHADAVLLSLGWLPRTQARQPHIAAASPIDQALESIGAGEQVAVRGIGMGFIDLVSIVTEERGGEFVPADSPSRPGELRYLASGDEPRLFAGSRTGLPFLAKPDFGTVPPAAKFTRLHLELASLLERRPLDFDADVLPLIEHAAAGEHYRVLAEHHPEAFSRPPHHLLELFEGSVDRADIASARANRLTETGAWKAEAAQSVTDEALRFHPARVGLPILGRTAAELDAATLGRLTRDAADASLGHRSAHKRGLHVYQAARAAIIPLTDFGGVSPESRPELQRFMSLANLIGSGPPLFRAEQLIALHRAGVVTFVGPQLQVRELDGRTLVSSELAPADEFVVDRVVDAYLDLPDATRLNDPLLNSLLDGGLARIWPGDLSRPTIEITAQDSALVGTDGAATAGLHSVGPLHEELRRFTIIAPIPGARSTVLREIDSAVEAMLARVASALSAPSQAFDPEPVAEP